ncbi:hypothetical protein GCM10023196_055950 [Actinoallomurus vinaceus]|uniref:Uncharacterized protein n=1 Tax=Actinoallomurus vinaceus TaxID=1080074 RepID=A0ABP8UG59_9ACTN
MEFEEGVVYDVFGRCLVTDHEHAETDQAGRMLAVQRGDRARGLW